MYSQARHVHVTTSTTTALERRPDLRIAKSPHWSYSHSLEQSYPSPPMSDTPNSPRRSSLYQETSSSSAYPRSYPASSEAAQPRGYPPPPPPATNMEGPMLPAAPVYQQAPYGHDPRSYYPPPPRPDMQARAPPAQLPYAPQQYDPYLPPAPPSLPMMGSSSQPLMPAVPAYQGRAEPQYQQGPTSLSSASAPRSQRTTRRTKAHVAKACQNCKKAHLSCDEARPCARCVASGKQSTCVDVEHKKRGRPRLRDDREQRLEQAAAAAAAATQAAPQAIPGQGPGPSRGHRRGDSLRVLRSQQASYGSGSDDSRPGTSQGLDPPRLYAPTAAYPSSYPGVRPAPAQLSAFLNLDLRFMKVSEPLRALLGGNQDIFSRPLSDFVTEPFEVALQRIQNELRDERARRDPTHLPAIFSSDREREAVQGYEPENAEALSDSFLDRQDVYTFRTAVRMTEQFQVRIRLARTTTFIATMVLYRLPPPQPAIAPSPFARGPQYAMPDPLSPARSPYHVSNPGSPFSTLPTALMTTLPPPSSIPASSYGYGEQPGYFPRAGMQPPPPPPPQQYPHTPAPRSRPSTATGHRRSRADTGSLVQLPPIVSSAPTTPTGLIGETIAGSSSAARRRTPERTGGSDGDEEDGRKRRRLNIRDIVEK